MFKVDQKILIKILSYKTIKLYGNYQWNDEISLNSFRHLKFKIKPLLLN